jgi:hypothetical protein
MVGVHLGYNGDAPIFHCRLSMDLVLDVCEASMMIPFNPTEPWLGSIIGSVPNTTIKMMAHIALTSMCEDHLSAIAALPIVLLLIMNQENPMWQRHLEAVLDLKGPGFSAVIALLAKYSQYLFNLQHNTARAGMQQCMSLTTYEQHATSTSCEMEGLRHENAILHSGALLPSEQDLELEVAYHHLSEAKHGWNYTRQLLDITREEVEIRSHGIIHLEHAFETHEAEIKERAEMIANLK